MSAKTAPIGPFLGINNRLKRHALHTDAGDYLADAVNADLDNSGKLSRRGGVTKVVSLTTGRSVFSDGSRTLFADGTSLKRITSFSPFASSTIDTVSANSIAYTAINGEVFYSDGVKLGCVQPDNTIRKVGIPVPASLSVATTTGSLLAGWYQVAATYFYGSEEGGAYPSVNVELLSTEGLSVTLPAAPDGVTGVGIYLSGLNGEVPMLHSIVSPATATVTLSSAATGRECLTQFKSPMPAGNILAHLLGRLLVASGKTLYFSEAYWFGLTNRLKNYIPFPADITVVQPCVNGVYVVADRTYWITGLGTDEQNISPVLPYGAVAGTGGNMRNGNVAYWLGERGLVIGDSQGQVNPVQEKDMQLSLSGSGASIFIEGINRIVATNG